MKSVELLEHSKGFTKFTHNLLDGILVGDLNSRQLLVIALILRLSNGCHREWAKVKKADLTIVGISNQHAKEVIEPMIQKGILITNEKLNELKVNEKFFTKGRPSKEKRMEKLRKVIGKNLPRPTSQKGNTNVPDMGSDELPKEEVQSSQIGQLRQYPKREDLASEMSGFASLKDIVKIS